MRILKNQWRQSFKPAKEIPARKELTRDDVAARNRAMQSMTSILGRTFNPMRWPA